MRNDSKRKTIVTVVTLIGTLIMAIYYTLATIATVPQALKAVREIIGVKPTVRIEGPIGEAHGVDYGLPITPLKLLPNGSCQVVILTVDNKGAPLSFAQVFFLADNETYGPYISDINGMIIIPFMRAGEYKIYGNYKGFTSSKIIFVPEGQKRLYELRFPVYMEVLGIPLTFGALIALVIGVIILIIVITITISEYLRWRSRRLKRTAIMSETSNELTL